MLQVPKPRQSSTVSLEKGLHQWAGRNQSQTAGSDHVGGMEKSPGKRALDLSRDFKGIAGILSWDFIRFVLGNTRHQYDGFGYEDLSGFGT